jgi:hypothetical protein
MVNLDKYFEQNYNLITEWTDSIYGRTEINSGDVISELYLDLRKRQLPPNDKEMKFYILRWLKSRTYWQGGNPIKNYRIPERVSNDKMLVDLFVYEMEQDEVSKDLQRAGFNLWEIEKISSCIEVSKGMPLYFKRLFVLYYVDGLTMEAIGNSCNLPKSAIYTQLEKIKKYLKQHLKLEPEKMLL